MSRNYLVIDVIILITSIMLVFYSKKRDERYNLNMNTEYEKRKTIILLSIILIAISIKMLLIILNN
jgi:hypothetical protein